MFEKSRKSLKQNANKKQKKSLDEKVFKMAISDVPKTISYRKMKKTEILYNFVQNPKFLNIFKNVQYVVESYLDILDTKF